MFPSSGRVLCSVCSAFISYCELSHFSSSIYRQWVSLVSATPLTVLYRPFWNFACVFVMVWGCACGLDINVTSFLSLFLYCELSHFSPSIYRQWVHLVSTTPLTVLYRSFWNFAFFLHGMRMCMSLGYNCYFIFFSLFPYCELSNFSPSIYRQWVPLVRATPLTVLYRSFWNFACVLFMVWGCAWGLDIIITLFFVTFSILWT